MRDCKISRSFRSIASRWSDCTDQRVEILGRLPEYRTSTGFAVTPVVGWTEPPVAFRPDPHEVAEVFEVPLAFLLDPLRVSLAERLGLGQPPPLHRGRPPVPRPG